jgi:hypothetical protein
MLTTAQCDDREKVLFAAGRLQGTAGAWWDAYVAAHATPDGIIWQEFTISFRNHYIPAGLMKLKKKEFPSLKQGGNVSGRVPGQVHRVVSLCTRGGGK